MSKKMEADIIILGVGTCGEDLSLRLLDAGIDVIGIEADLIGGECPYWACIPSKVMIQAAAAVQETRRAAPMTGNPEITPDWTPLAARLRWITGAWDDSVAVKRYAERGGTMIKGRGRLTGPNTVSVAGHTYSARRGIVIAVGSKPYIPPIEGIDTIDYWTTRDIMKTDSLPSSMLVLGGGPAGCELGQVMARFGVDVTIIEPGHRLLSREEPETSEVLEAAFNDEGIVIHKGARAERVQSRAGSILTRLTDGTELDGDRLLIAAGRAVDLNGLGLESVGLDPSSRFINVDEYMRAADGIWAMGDVTGKSLQTHVAEYQSAVIAAEILGYDHPPARYDAVPRCIFTDPEIGAVGMTEARASEQGLDTAIALKELSRTFRGLIDGVQHGFIKLIADRKNGTLIGATVVGPRGTDMLGMLNLAVHARVPVKELQTMIYGFPSFYGAIGEALGVRKGLTTVLDPDYRGIEDLEKVKR
jgi:pyruvate/2-oxoglutarate dehydrogenase complex dihydrolipoamide dehydrogenase (E3) component